MRQRSKKGMPPAVSLVEIVSLNVFPSLPRYPPGCGHERPILKMIASARLLGQRLLAAPAMWSWSIQPFED